MQGNVSVVLMPFLVGTAGLMLSAPVQILSEVTGLPLTIIEGGAFVLIAFAVIWWLVREMPAMREERAAARDAYLKSIQELQSEGRSIQREFLESHREFLTAIERMLSNK
mgnify:CR=1 FL=1